MKSIFGKPVLELNKSGLFKETKWFDDLRAVFLAYFLEDQIEESHSKSNISGVFKYYYKRTAFLRRMTALFILFLITIQKPEWCTRLGNSISSDCTRSDSGESYYIFLPMFQQGVASTLFIYLLMYLLLFFHLMKSNYSVSIVQSDNLKLYQ